MGLDHYGIIYNFHNFPTWDTYLPHLHLVGEEAKAEGGSVTCSESSRERIEVLVLGYRPNQLPQQCLQRQVGKVWLAG